MKMIFPRNRRL